MGDVFFSEWPSNWRQLEADLCKFYGWGPDQVSTLTGAEMVWFAEQANRINTKQAEAQASGRQR